MLFIGVDNCLSSQTQSLSVTTSPSEKLKGELSLNAVIAEVIPGPGDGCQELLSPGCQQISTFSWTALAFH